MTDKHWYIVQADGKPDTTGPSVLYLDSVDPTFPGGIKWRPINNYASFAGFPSAGARYAGVLVSPDSRSISFGSVK